MKVLCTICARGGSKGVKSKNTKNLSGKPLIAWTVEQALSWGKAHEVIVSTDNDEIAEVALKYGAEVPFKRPSELASDNAAKLPVIQHAVKFMEEKEGSRYDFIVDLDPTSPLRNVEDIDKAFQLLINNLGADNLYSVCRARKSPYFNMVELDQDGYASLSKPLSKQIIRRQDAPVVYEMNASIYVYKRDFLVATDAVFSDKSIIYEMPAERSVDIDSEVDFKFVEFLMKEKIRRGETENE